MFLLPNGTYFLDTPRIFLHVLLFITYFITNEKLFIK
jgi:hypothetical protein